MQETDEFDRSVFNLTLYLLTAARGCIEEPPTYGALRLVEAASRLIAFAREVKGDRLDGFLYDVKRVIDEKKHVVLQSEAEFTRMIDELIDKFVDELKSRKRSRNNFKELRSNV